MMQDVFIMAEPLKRVRKVRADVQPRKKMTLVYVGERRYTLGKTAFLHEIEAEECKIKRLRKIVENKQLQRYSHTRPMYESAAKQLAQLDSPLSRVVRIARGET